MKAVILAGGLGTRLSEETGVRPKPMVEIGGRPVLWHILKIYSHYGINDFVICCGYKGYLIKEYFANYFLHMSDVTFDMSETGCKFIKAWLNLGMSLWLTPVTTLVRGEDSRRSVRIWPAKLLFV